MDIWVKWSALYSCVYDHYPGSGNRNKDMEEKLMFKRTNRKKGKVPAKDQLQDD